jgi:hypothetical protein
MTEQQEQQQQQSENPNPNQIRIRNNGKLHEIKISSDDLAATQKTLKSNISEIVKNDIVRKLSGMCCICGEIATQMVTYDVSDEKQAAHRIERYCDACVKKVYEREPVL